jgi:hypothetical protein
MCPRSVGTRQALLQGWFLCVGFVCLANVPDLVRWLRYCIFGCECRKELLHCWIIWVCVQLCYVDFSLKVISDFRSKLTTLS